MLHLLETRTIFVALPGSNYLQVTGQLTQFDLIFPAFSFNVSNLDICCSEW